jgi:tRNA threonylcarbamoyladenosine biosynthesis protein TsaE
LWLRSPSPDATRAAGRLLGKAFGPEGGVVALTGPLGAGKTLFVKGLAEGLGIAPELVASPTFVIAAEYPLGRGRVLCHVDLYRLATAEELDETGFRDSLVPGNVVAIEWSDRLPGALPPDRLTVAIGPGTGGSQRVLDAIASGPVARSLLERWRAEIETTARASGLESSSA